MFNTWPDDYRHAMYQDEHERYNQCHYPGTRQLCSKCDTPTGKCEDDTLHDPENREPLCIDCWLEIFGDKE